MDKMTARYKSDNWKHVLKLNNSSVQCNIDSCDQIYYNNTKFTNKLITLMNTFIS